MTIDQTFHIIHTFLGVSQKSHPHLNMNLSHTPKTCKLILYALTITLYFTFSIMYAIYRCVTTTHLNLVPKIVKAHFMLQASTKNDQWIFAE